MVVATLAAGVAAARIGHDTDVNEVFFAGTRAPLVQALIDTLGTQRTAVILYLFQRSFDALIVATAFAPIFYWVLGSTAVHASARLAGLRRPFRPVLLLAAYASALTLIPSSLATAAFGAGTGLGPQLASLVGIASTVWLLVIAHRTIQAHYAVDGSRAVRILVVAVVAFYVLPLLLIFAAVIAILVAAVVLEYF